jgi:hypothetical protein
MNKKIIVLFCMLLLVFPVFLSSQSSAKGSAVNGATGVIVAPTARIGWEYSDVGLEFGYGFLFNNGSFGQVPTFTLSFLKKAEVGLAFNIRNNNNFDILYHGKFQFFRDGGSAVAMGVKGEFSNFGNGGGFYMTPYLVATYSGNFFTWPAVTSMMFGWHMIENDDISENFAFSMAFELSLFPSAFKNYVFWISDFSNYSYATSSCINAGSRGSFNTGIRIDPIKKGRFKLVFDIVGTDLLDSSRGLMVSGLFGLGF